jgi:hypothetical protein
VQKLRLFGSHDLQFDEIVHYIHSEGLFISYTYPI